MPVGDTWAYCPTFPAEVVDWGVSGLQSALGKIQELSLSARGAGLGRSRRAREGFRRLSGTARPCQRPDALWPQQKDHALGGTGGCLQHSAVQAQAAAGTRRKLGNRAERTRKHLSVLSPSAFPWAQGAGTVGSKTIFLLHAAAQGLASTADVHPDQPQRHDFGEPFLRLGKSGTHSHSCLQP